MRRKSIRKIGKKVQCACAWESSSVLLLFADYFSYSSATMLPFPTARREVTEWLPNSECAWNLCMLVAPGHNWDWQSLQVSTENRVRPLVKTAISKTPVEGG